MGKIRPKNDLKEDSDPEIQEICILGVRLDIHPHQEIIVDLVIDPISLVPVMFCRVWGIQVITKLRREYESSEQPFNSNSCGDPLVIDKFSCGFDQNIVFPDLGPLRPVIVEFKSCRYRKDPSKHPCCNL